MATKKRLIDANAMREDWLENGENEYVYDTNAVIDSIDAQPTVDAVEVVHGHWIFKHNPIDDPKRYFVRIVCSNCNLHTGQKSNYCPQCGAKMDGDSSNG